MQKVFEIIDTEDIETTTKSYPIIIEPIVKRNFGNTFHHYNGTIQCYHTQKKKATRINPDNTTNHETSNLHIWKKNVLAVQLTINMQ